jgi:hypothetical protein
MIILATQSISNVHCRPKVAVWTNLVSAVIIAPPCYVKANNAGFCICSSLFLTGV